MGANADMVRSAWEAFGRGDIDGAVSTDGGVGAGSSSRKPCPGAAPTPDRRGSRR